MANFLNELTLKFCRYYKFFFCCLFMCFTFFFKNDFSTLFMIYLLVASLFQLLGFSTETSLKVRIKVQKFYSNFGTLYDLRFVIEPAYQKKGGGQVCEAN